ncbi:MULTISPECIES: phage tail protein [unclassified Pseudoalteromonas]|uniref:phage tail protein n=1 Tax=unclassified Pseudoalteromonas TaxID=194690 RepID=UPI001603D1CA|nr:MULTISPECIES: tail fiber protein [unclassified Pseudoalteromonas]MBB1332653.1 phage tail protein [Pseudoalteromonas sp. SR41-6]MBB1342952.1 phage tail protein [Pseudoalteromonas sp. SR45-6]MBB1460207.1 phage tail protein [Pseudoalteromonas sp. SG41-8]
MADPFISEIRPFAFDFAPKNWAFCNGGVIAITQNGALYALLGTQFGGNGTSDFKLPDLRGRTPIGSGFLSTENRPFYAGDSSGEETVRLTLDEMPAHTHAVKATASIAANSPAFTDRIFSESKDNKCTSAEPFVYGSSLDLTELAQDVVSSSGSGSPHTNLQPLLVLNFCIALEGTFPARN